MSAFIQYVLPILITVFLIGLPFVWLSKRNKLPETVPGERARRSIAIWYSVLLIPATFYAIGMLLGGFIFFFDAPLQGTLDFYLRWFTIFCIIISPVCLATSLFMTRKHSLNWGWLGVAPIFLLIFVSLVATLLQ